MGELNFSSSLCAELRRSEELAERGPRTIHRASVHLSIVFHFPVRHRSRSFGGDLIARQLFMRSGSFALLQR